MAPNIPDWAVGANVSSELDTWNLPPFSFQNHTDGDDESCSTNESRSTQLGVEMAEVTYYVALPYLAADDGVATHWSSRGMKASGLSVSSVQRIWRAFGLQPHRMETFKLSTDPDFVAKVRDVVGLYPRAIEPVIAIVLGWISWKSALVHEVRRRKKDDRRTTPVIPRGDCNAEPLRKSWTWQSRAMLSL
jgi:hypothetical protein